MGDLKRVWSREAFLKLKGKYSNICLVHLYSFEGVIEDVEYNKPSEETKKSLKNLMIK